MPRHSKIAETIAHLQAQVDLLKEAHKEEKKAIASVEKAHTAEGKKVHSKRMGAKSREALKAMHAKEGEALSSVMAAHADETGLIRDVAKTQKKVSAKALKGAPVPVMKSAEVKPEAAAAVATEATAKKGRGRPKKKPTVVMPAKAAEGPAAKPEKKPRMKLIKVVEPGMAPAELAGKSPETGPQETAKSLDVVQMETSIEKKPRGRPKKVKMQDPKEKKTRGRPKKEKAPVMKIEEVEIKVPAMPSAKKTKAEPKKMMGARHLIEKGLITKENASKIVKKAKDEVEDLFTKEVHSFEEDEERSRELADAKEFRAAAIAAKGILMKKNKD